MAVMSNQQTGKITVAIDTQIQYVVRNLGRHVQASLKSIEIDLMEPGAGAAHAHVLESEHCMWR